MTIIPRIPGGLTDAIEYGIDATQRGILYWDMLRERGSE